MHINPERIMSKKNKTPLGIFTESIGLYFSNIDKFIKYMTFPVIGQILGLVLVFLLTLFYSKNMPLLITKFPNLDNFNLLLITAILIMLPGLIIFTKAFWEYLIAYGAINSMLENMLKSGKVYDFDAHTELIKRRSFSFISLWFLFGLFSLIALIPFFWVPCGVFAVFFVLIFQVFTYEPELSPIDCAKKSLQLIKGHFASTFMLMALIGALTYIFIPQVINYIFDITKLSQILSAMILPLIIDLPIQEVNAFLNEIHIQALQTKDIAFFVISTTIAQIAIQFTLPLRSILWGMWYKELNGALPKTFDKTTKKRTKKASEKLMEQSHKKFTTKKIDKNILKRAMEKDD